MILFASGTLALYSYVEDSNDCVDFYGLKTYFVQRRAV